MKQKCICVSLLCIFLLSLLSAFSYAAKIISSDGEFSTDGVDVSIETITEDKLLAPNMTVEYKPIIHYQGVDAYVRFTLDISNENLDLSAFHGLGKDWVKRGEYFYYTKPVHHDEELTTFTSLHLPESWTEQEPKDMMNSSFKITAYCDALQARNFTPDFEAEKPWGDLEIEDNSYDGKDFVKKENLTNASVQLHFKRMGEYALSSKTLLKQSILPGDTYKGEICLFNDSENPMEIFFSTKKMNVEEENNLFDNLSLLLKIDGREIYAGTLRAAKLNGWTSILTMQPGKVHRLEYEVHMPTEFQNEYEQKWNPFVWNFTAQEKYSPKTGDTAHLFAYLLLAILSLLLLFVVKKKGKPNEV